MTSMPWSIRLLMIAPTAFSLPGMAREEKITRSPLESAISGMLVLGDAGERGAGLALRAGEKRHDLVARHIAEGVRPSGTPACLRDSRIRFATSTTRSMARPTTTTSRPHSRAASATERMRATFDAKVVIATRCGASLISSASFARDIGFARARSVAHHVGGIADQRQHALVAESAEGLLRVRLPR